MSVSKILKQELTVIDDDLTEITQILNEVLGEREDLVAVPYAEGNSVYAFLHTGYYHVHGKSFTYPDNANSILLTSGNGAWNLTGNIIEVVPANALNYADFDLHWIDIADISANSFLQVDIFAGPVGAEVRIGSAPAHRTAVQAQEGARPVQIPQQLKNTRISCRLSDSTAGNITCRVKLMGHYYKI